MQHHFEVGLAEKYGIVEAILINHFEYWIELNRTNDRNFYEGRYWTFNSMKAFIEIFPYLSEKKIRNALKHLQDEGLILTGNFNRSSYDRTLWYAFSDLAESILPKGQMEESKKANGNNRKGGPIPDNNAPENKDINNKRRRSASDISDERFNGFWREYPKHVAKQSAIKAWEKLNPDDELVERIITAVQKQKKWDQWKQDNGKYVPYASTWLNQGRWDDEQTKIEGGLVDGYWPV